MATKTYTDISTHELNQLIDEPATILVDVRDEWEFDEFNLGGLNIPLADIRQRKKELLGYQNIAVICTNGIRSRVAAKDLCRQPEFQEKTIYHLHGGILETEV